MSISTASLQFLIFLGVMATLVELCGNVNTSGSTVTTTGTPASGGRKRRDVNSGVIHVELLTTLTEAGDVEFGRIEDSVGSSYQVLLANSHRQVADGIDGGKVLKYMIQNADCGEVQLFANAAMDTTSFVTGGSVRCGDQVSEF